jgi:hypothetical protein
MLPLKETLRLRLPAGFFADADSIANTAMALSRDRNGRRLARRYVLGGENEEKAASIKARS